MTVTGSDKLTTASNLGPTDATDDDESWPASGYEPGYASSGYVAHCMSSGATSVSLLMPSVTLPGVSGVWVATVVSSER